MVLSQNASFVGDPPPDPEYNHPPGAALARELQMALRHRGIEVTEIENWRDAGWVISSRQGQRVIDIVFAQDAPSEWMLQIAPIEEPGFFDTLFKRGPDYAVDLFHLAQAVAEILPELGYSRMRWRTNGKPRDGDPSSPTIGV